MNLNYRLYEIICRYHIFEETPELYDYYYDYVYEEVVNKALLNISDKARVVIRGGGVQCEKIISSMTTSNRKKIMAIVDKRKTGNIHGIPILSIQQASELNYDVVIVGTYAYRGEVHSYYDGYGINVIDFFDDLIDCFHDKSDDYLFNPKLKYIHVTYLDINMCIEELGQIKNVSEEYLHLQKKLFGYFIDIKDFYDAKILLDHLCGNENLYSNLLDFWNELDRLFEIVKECLKQKKQKSIIINWIDNVCAEDFYECKYAEQLFHNAIVFDNAYTVTPWTHNVFDEILTGKYPIESDFEKRKHELYSNDNSILLRLLCDKKYSFLYYANPGLYYDKLPEGMSEKMRPGFDEIINGERAMSECSTRHHWDVLCNRIASDKLTCYLIHNLCETHDPYVYVGRNTDIKRFGKKRELHKNGIECLTKQLVWYQQFEELGSRSQIYMSDHGDFWETPNTYDRKRANVILFVKGDDIKPRNCHDLISLIDFHKLIDGVLKGDDLSSLGREYVIFENLDIVSQEVVDAFIELWKKTKSFNMNALRVEAMLTKGGNLFAKYATGKVVENICDNKNVDEDKVKFQEYINRNSIAEADGKRKRTSELYDYMNGIDKSQLHW